MMHPVKNLKTCTRTLTDDSQDVDLIVKDYTHCWEVGTGRNSSAPCKKHHPRALWPSMAHPGHEIHSRQGDAERTARKSPQNQSLVSNSSNRDTLGRRLT